MSAKPSEPKPSDPVDDVTDKLADLNNGDGAADSAASKKAQKKARQKAKKDAQKSEEQPSKADTNGEGEAKADKTSKKTNKNKKKNTQDKTPKTQTDPPTVPISALFPSGNFPEGQIMEHPIGNDDAKAKQRFTSEEARALDRAQLDMYNEIR